MPYRDFELPDGRVVRTRVSDAATLEWYDDREECLKRGYPDRPPDIDTDTMRQWLANGDEIDEPSSQVSSWPIAMYVLDLGAALPTVKLILSWMDPGDIYYVRMKAESGVDIGATFFDGEKFYTPEQTDQMNDMIDRTLQTMHEMERLAISRAMGDPHWLITTPGDVVRMNEEMEQARADFDAEYGRPAKGTTKQHGTGHVREDDQRRPTCGRIS